MNRKEKYWWDSMKSILIIGMGEFGKHLAYKLLSLKNEVCIVDNDDELINVLSKDFENAYIGDCMQKATLSELGVNNFDICIVAIGESFQASLEITSHLKELGAKHIISKATSEVQTKFLKMAGADEVVYPEKDIAEKLAVKCNATNLLDYIQISDEYSIVEMLVLKDWVGHNIKELDVRNNYDVNVIEVSNNGKVDVPSADYCFEENDHIFIFGKDKTIRKLKKKG